MAASKKALSNRPASETTPMKETQGAGSGSEVQAPPAASSEERSEGEGLVPISGDGDSSPAESIGPVGSLESGDLSPAG